MRHRRQNKKDSTKKNTKTNKTINKKQVKACVIYWLQENHYLVRLQKDVYFSKKKEHKS